MPAQRTCLRGELPTPPPLALASVLYGAPRTTQEPLGGEQEATSSPVPVVAPKTSKPVAISLEEFHALDEKRPRQDVVFSPEHK